MEEEEEGEAEEEGEEIEVIEGIEGIVEVIEEVGEEDKIEEKEEGEIMMILTKRKYTWIKILEKSQPISCSANSSLFNKKKVLMALSRTLLKAGSRTCGYIAWQFQKQAKSRNSSRN